MFLKKLAFSNRFADHTGRSPSESIQLLCLPGGLYLSDGALALLSPLVLLAAFIRLITPVLMSLHYQTNKRLVAALGSTNLLGCTRGSVCIGAARFCFCAPLPVAPLHTACPFSLSPPPRATARVHAVRELSRACAYYACKIAVAVR